MKKTIDFADFQQAFKDMGRENNFSPDGLRVLFDYLEGYEDATGEQIELDVIALCCDYQELERWEFLDQYECLTSAIEDNEETEGEITMAIEHYAEMYLHFVGWVSGHESIIIGA